MFDLTVTVYAGREDKRIEVTRRGDEVDLHVRTAAGESVASVKMDWPAAQALTRGLAVLTDA